MVSDAWKTYNASAPAGQFARETISLFHAGFSQDWHFTRYPSSFSAFVRSASVTFDHHPFKLRWPSNDTSGRVELQIDFFNTGADFVAEVQSAHATPETPIEVELNAYLETGGASDIDAIVLSGTRVSMTPTNVTLLATKADVLNKKWPVNIYRPSFFPGLVR